MNKKILLFIILTLFNVTINVKAQNLKGIKNMNINVFYNEEADKFKNYLCADEFIKNIKYDIKDIDFSKSLEITGVNNAFMVLQFDIYKDVKQFSDNIYYGTISLKVYKWIFDKNTDNLYNAIVYFSNYCWSLTNPTNEMIKSDAKEITYNLVKFFSSEYYKDN